MFQSNWRWSSIMCKSTLLTVMTMLLAGLFFLTVPDSIASPLKDESTKKITEDYQASLDKDVLQNENQSDITVEQSNKVSFDKDDKLLIPQTETSPQNLRPLKKTDETNKDNQEKETISDTKSKKDTNELIEINEIKTKEEVSETKTDEVPETKTDNKAVSKTKKNIKKKSDKEKKIKKIELPKVRGKSFVEGVIGPLNYELNERFWGWRPNDYINVTDNVNNLQLGILEVTRRTVVVLAHRISRTGSNDKIDANLENAMNWLMIKAKQYWFPSPESKYNQAIDELNQYVERLERGRANFFVRTDNLIPLLQNYEDLLGGCDKNLTIKKDEDGPIGSSKADDYFYYAQGVAIAMGSIFRGIRKDFSVTLKSVQAEEILDQAIESCDNAANIAPWVVTEGSLSSIFANHRANIDQPINRIRFYMNVMIRTLKGY